MRSGVSGGAPAGSRRDIRTTVPAPPSVHAPSCRPAGRPAPAGGEPSAASPGAGRASSHQQRRTGRPAVDRERDLGAAPAAEQHRRPTSLSAVATRIWSWRSRPTAAATSRPRWRTTKMSCSTRRRHAAAARSARRSWRRLGHEHARRRRAGRRRRAAAVAAITSGDVAEQARVVGRGSTGRPPRRSACTTDGAGGRAGTRTPGSSVAGGRRCRAARPCRAGRRPSRRRRRRCCRARRSGPCRRSGRARRRRPRRPGCARACRCRCSTTAGGRPAGRVAEGAHRRLRRRPRPAGRARARRRPAPDAGRPRSRTA